MKSYVIVCLNCLRGIR